jgi:hypothetical protein
MQEAQKSSVFFPYFAEKQVDVSRPCSYNPSAFSGTI